MNDAEVILLVVNPVSGNSNKKEFIQIIEKKLRKNSQLHSFYTSGNGDQEKLSKEIERYRPDRILVLGGDGTIKLTAEALGEKSIGLGIIPAGSANGLANDLGLPFDSEDAVTVALGQKTREIDAIRINGELCLHISDFGVNAELIKNYEESNLRGKLGYLFHSISTLYNSEMPYRFKIETEGKSKEYKAIMLAFANSRKYGTGAVVNPHGKIDDGKFEILIFKRFNFFEILKTLRHETEVSSDFIEHISTTKATVTADVPVNFQIDGEYCDKLKKVEAEIIPKKLCIFVN
ncbi:MAG TPA: YegS/Rv2252/BmrU family lipid kinase [Flavobacteriaceae bacterium]|nr:YegS/Rv2252/BmrU family lipid kinase [Flavobacteriaceae bacterium]